ncbi:MAG: nicotinamide riboside transporter PnuC [Actinomycetota bacterium]|nr:nicotinamide riboside transporter PnuC [Actinomycetota bacterium]
MSWVEWAGFITGAVCVILVVREHIANFPVGIANNVFFAVLFVQAGLYADAGLQGVFLVLGLQGWWLWLHGGRDRGPLVIRPLSAQEWQRVAVGVVAATGALTWALMSWTDSTVPFWDALTTALSLGAQWLLNRKHTATWYLWITADVLYIGLYFHKDLRLTAVLYAGFLGLCLLGLRQWRAAERKQLVLAA